ncbi:MAG: hypothetical protein ACLUSP_05475 [Christensenellales bacterium]
MLLRRRGFYYGVLVQANRAYYRHNEEQDSRLPHVARSRFEDLSGTVIGCDVSIEAGAVIGYNNIVVGGTCIRRGAKLKANNYIEDCIIDEEAVLDSSHAVSSYVGKRATVGPYANLRAGNVIGDDCHIGDFVELKACNIGRGCKMGHLTYAGNVNMGEDCNVGAGVVFANYDGKEKHSSIVGNRAFIGSSSTIVAPSLSRTRRSSQPVRLLPETFRRARLRSAGQGR